MNAVLSCVLRVLHCVTFPRVCPAACCAVPSGGIAQLRAKHVLHCL
jgi:hypothetical protein